MMSNFIGVIIGGESIRKEDQMAIDNNTVGSIV